MQCSAGISRSLGVWRAFSSMMVVWACGCAFEPSLCCVVLGSSGNAFDTKLRAPAAMHCIVRPGSGVVTAQHRLPFCLFPCAAVKVSSDRTNSMLRRCMQKQVPGPRTCAVWTRPSLPTNAVYTLAGVDVGDLSG